MTAPTPERPLLILTDEGERRWVRVTGRPGAWFRRHRIPAYKSVSRGGAYLHRSRVADVLALAQAEGVPVKYREKRRPATRPAGRREGR